MFAELKRICTKLHESPQWKLGQLIQWLGRPMGKRRHYFNYSECAANTDVAYQTFFNCYRSRYKFAKNRFYDLIDMLQSLLWRMSETFFLSKY
jgi:hypothetical protein